MKPEEINQAVQHYQQQPNDFFLHVLGREAWDKQQEINDAVARSNKVAIRSCHASGKTWDAAGLVCWYLTCYPESTVLTTAPTFRQVEQLMWREIRTAYRKSIVPLGGTMLNTRWEIEDNWFAVGLSTDEPDNFSGFHAPHMLIVVDEGSGVSDSIFEAIEGVMAGGNCKLVIIGNPTRLTGAFAKAFKDPTFVKLKISGFDTPNVKAGRVVIPGLMKPEYPAEMAAKYGKESDIYLIKVLGEFPKKESDTLISVDQVDQAIKRMVEPEGTKKMGVDVARFGGNKSVILIRQGHKVFANIIKLAHNDTMELAGLVMRTAKDNGIDAHDINIDDVGVGGGVTDRLHEQEFYVNGVNVGDKAIDSDLYLNRRAEGWYEMSRDIDQLDLPNDEDFYQLAQPKYKYTSSGQRKIESKEDMTKRGVESPDVGDALMLTYIPKPPSAGLYI